MVIKHSFRFNWTTETTRELFHVNDRKVKQDVQHDEYWSFHLNSTIWMIKMKLLTRLLYLFPDLPIIVKYKVNQQPKNKEKHNLG